MAQHTDAAANGTPTQAPPAAAWDSKSRDGYYGDMTSGKTLATDGKPRIVLSEEYGREGEGSGKTKSPHSQTELANSQTELAKAPGAGGVPLGLAGRYVGKVTIITGGSKGIGEGCSRVFHAAGSHVVFCSRGEADGKKLESELNGLGQKNRALFVKADVSRVEDLRRVVDETLRAFDRIDCLINNAGWHPPPKTIDDFSVEELQDLFQLNFVSYFAMCKFCLPKLRESRGNIINMSSWVGINGQAQAPTYASTKGAITSFSKALAIDEAALPSQVRVNIVSPGNIWTPLWKSWSDGEPDPVAAKEAGDLVQVMARKGTIEETGRLCLCIAADLTFTTGVDHVQSGGAELGYGVKAKAEH